MVSLINAMFKIIRPVSRLAVWLVCAGGAHGDILLEERFDYTDGSLAEVSAGDWAVHSGTLPLNVAAGEALVGQSDFVSGGEDLHRLLLQSYNPLADNVTKLYAGFTVNFKTLPVNSGTYTGGSFFAHFMTSDPLQYYGRVGANMEGAAAGHFRLAIASLNWNSASSQEYPLDLSLGTSYRVVIGLDLSTDQTRLWVNPIDENSLSVTAPDLMTYSGGQIVAFALCQGTTLALSQGYGAPGELGLDDLVVATRFSEALVIPEPSPWGLLVFGCAAVCMSRKVSRC